jgi:hypothetical protein
MPPIIPRERFGADRRDLLHVGDILIGQAGADARPCFLEPRLRVDEIGGVAPVVTALRSALRGAVHPSAIAKPTKIATASKRPQRGIVKSANQERFGGSRFRGFLKR